MLENTIFGVLNRVSSVDPVCPNIWCHAMSQRNIMTLCDVLTQGKKGVKAMSREGVPTFWCSHFIVILSYYERPCQS